LTQQKNAQESVSSSNNEKLHYLTIEEKLKELWKKEEEILNSLGVDTASK
jgi:hypothetical protein